MVRTELDVQQLVSGNFDQDVIGQLIQEEDNGGRGTIQGTGLSSLSTDPGYPPVYWRRVENPSRAYDCAGLVLRRLCDTPQHPVDKYWITAPQFYDKVIQSLAQPVTRPPYLEGDIIVLIKRKDSNGPDHVAMVINKEPAPTISAVKIVTKDEAESVFENLLELGLDRGDWINLGVRPGGPAVGRLRTGDVITSVNGNAVTSAQQIANLLAGIRSGDTVRFQVTRGDQQLDVGIRVE